MLVAECDRDHDGSLVYFEASIVCGRRNPSFCVGFRGAGGVDILFDASTGALSLGGRPLHSPLRSARTETQEEDESGPLVAGAGLDHNGRVFFTRRGLLVSVPLDMEGCGAPFKIEGNTALTLRAEAWGPGALESVLLCHAPAVPSSFAYKAAADGDEGAVFADVSRWLSTTGFSPLAGRVVVRRGCLGPGATDDDTLAFEHFSWESIFAEGPRGAAAKREREAKVRVFKDTEYEINHTGGFVRLCTMRGRAYWITQNTASEHTTPDWKIHFSVHLDDIPVAWNLLAALFMESGCDMGMKATYIHLLPGGWSEKQRGREMTVYIYKYDPRFDGAGGRGGEMAACFPEDSADFCRVWLGREFELPADFYTSFVATAEARLRANGVRSRGCAEGDLPLGHYASLRNEAFVQRPTRCLMHTASGKEWREVPSLVYPPNDSGWNAADQPCPVNIFNMRCVSSGLPVVDASAAAALPTGVSAAGSNNGNSRQPWLE